jgi:multiple sugar transport system substrate-binding protein
MDEKTGRKIWENYYIPYIKEYFVKTGRFSSDDAKTGTVLAYTGSTAGASYFPTEVTFSENEIIEIEPLILPYPYFEEGTQYAMQQGAGMCISRSDYIHEYASAEFLKWFTQVEQNTEFAVSTGYFPVKNEALSKTALLGAAENAEFTNPAILASIESTITMFETYKFYNNPPFIGSFEIRELLESHLYNKITSNLELLESAGENRDIMIEEMISEASFMEWFNALKMDADQILNP